MVWPLEVGKDFRRLVVFYEARSQHNSKTNQETLCSMVRNV
jgi:hypothetical protein